MCDVCQCIGGSVTSLSNLLVEVCLSTILPTPTPTHHSTTHLTSLHSLSVSLHCCHADRQEETCSLERHFFRHSGWQLSLCCALLYTIALSCCCLRSPALFGSNSCLGIVPCTFLWNSLLAETFICAVARFCVTCGFFNTYCDEAQGKAKAKQTKKQGETKRREE